MRVESWGSSAMPKPWFRPEAQLIGGYLLAWLLSTLYLAARGADWTFPIISLVLFGGILTGVALLLTRRSDAPSVPVGRPRAEAIAILLYLLFYALFVLGWGLGAVRANVSEGPQRQIAELVFKLIFHVGLPIGLLMMLRAPIRPMFDAGLGRRGVLVTLILFSAIMFLLGVVVTPSLKQLAATGASGPIIAAGIAGSFLWMAAEAGLCEEFLFRAVLQSRLDALFRSPTAAILLAALLFSLAHVPGLYLRGGPGVDGWSTDPIQVVAFTIAALSPIAVLFGVLWARTRSLLLIVLIHSSVDTLPYSAEFITTWLQ
ncbi:MAG: CPBP family intramembrane metalloprotease [Sphingomonadales bacterium]|nr:MAG: CPBP family intramembrane metalloprotease [Sphingomonadales bacterium]